MHRRIGLKKYLYWFCVAGKTVQFSVQFIYASRPSTKYFIRNTGTGSDGISCHLRHCPHWKKTADAFDNLLVKLYAVTKRKKVKVKW